MCVCKFLKKGHCSREGKLNLRHPGSRTVTAIKAHVEVNVINMSGHTLTEDKIVIYEGQMKMTPTSDNQSLKL